MGNSFQERSAENYIGSTNKVRYLIICQGWFGFPILIFSDYVPSAIFVLQTLEMSFSRAFP